MEPPEQRPELPRMPSGVWEAADEPARRPDYASWGARAGALILDNLLMAIPWIVGVVFFVAAGAADDSGDGAGSLWFLGGLMILGAIVLPFLYFAILNGNDRGQTLGKRVAGIRVRRSDGVSPLGIGRALGRYALTFLFGILLGPLILLDYLWPLWDREKQALHDKAVGSVVVEA